MVDPSDLTPPGPIVAAPVARTPATEPQQIGSYRVVRTLSPGRSYLADGDGRRVVLKRMESECLTGPGLHRLHPMVRDRLGRVRELADLRVAHLFGVELIRDRAYMVWEYVEGIPIDAALRECPSSESFLGMVRELLFSVQSLHAHGIVHGSLDAGNVLFDRRGEIRLIDVSPLLFDDPRQDDSAVLRLLQLGLAPVDVSPKSRQPDWRARWIDLTNHAANQPHPLEWLRASLASSSDTSAEAADSRPGVAERTSRRRAIFAAIALTVVGLLITGAILAKHMVMNT